MPKATRKPKVNSATVARPYTTSYSGLWNGHCKTLQSANKAAFSHLIDGHARFAEIFDADGVSIARMRWEGGKIVVLPGFKRIRKDLIRVK